MSHFQPLYPGVVIDRAYAEYTANADLTTTIPWDDTVPQNTEGTQILSVSITPKTATNRIRLRFEGEGCSGSPENIIAALFQNSIASAIDARYTTTAGGGFASAWGLCIELVPGSTSAQTFAVRVGGGTTTIRMNGTNTARKFGAVSRATLTAEEIAA